MPDSIIDLSTGRHSPLLSMLLFIRLLVLALAAGPVFGENSSHVEKATLASYTSKFQVIVLENSDELRKGQDTHYHTETTSAIKCTIKRFENLYYVTGGVEKMKNVGKESTCAYLCWRRKYMEDRPCSSVNYLREWMICEFIDESLPPKVQQEHMVPNIQYTSNSTHIIPVKCSVGDQLDGASPSFNSSSKRKLHHSITHRPNKRASCGRSSHSGRVQKIVGGAPAKPHSHPWVVSLQWRGRHFCGGALLQENRHEEASKVVVTAAHCLRQSFGRGMRVVAGLHTQRSSSSGVRAGVKRIYTHRSYSSRTNVNDIAIIVLDKAIKFDDTIQPVCLPAQGEQVPEDAYLYAVGWGDTSEGGRATNELMEVAIPFVTASQCSADYRGQMKIYPQEMLCAGKTGKDSCQGDSGGPLTMKTAGGFVLQGVVSFGIGCGRYRRPGVYTRVSTYVKWINQRMASLRH